MLKRLASISTLPLLGAILFLVTPRMGLSQTRTLSQGTPEFTANASTKETSLLRPGFWAERRDLSIVDVVRVPIRCLPHLACSSGTVTVTCEGAPRQFNNFCAACCPEGSDCGNNPSLCRLTSPCNDTDACTEDLCVVDPYDNCEFAEASCSHRPLPADDGNKCTQDSCDPKTGVKNEPLLGINDGNLCTEDKCDTATGNITHTPVAIDDGNACTRDSCNPTTGEMTHTPIPDCPRVPPPPSPPPPSPPSSPPPPPPPPPPPSVKEVPPPPPPPPPPLAEQPMFICFTGKEVVIDGSTGKETPIEEPYRCPRLATLTALGTEQFRHAVSINEAFDDLEDDPAPENLKRFHDAIQNYVLYRAKMHMTDETERLQEQEYPTIFGLVLLGSGEKRTASLGLLSQDSLTTFHQKLLTEDLIFKDGKILKKTDLTQSGGQTGALMVEPSAVQLPEEPPVVRPLWAVDRLQAVGGGCQLIR